MYDPTSVEIPKAPAWLGGGGIVPFAGLTLLALFANKPEQRELATRAFVVYSGIILSFLGGVRWGAALTFPSVRLLTLAIAPSLVAFGCLLLPNHTALGFLGVTFAFIGLTDYTRGTHALWPMWYKRLRVRLTVAVVVLHLVLYFGRS
jgi:hypothetical protein